jgi:hypothetical protein
MFRRGRQAGLLFHLEVTAARATEWTRAYAHELPRVGKSAEEVVAEVAAREPLMRDLAGKLARGFLRIAGP